MVISFGSFAGISSSPGRGGSFPVKCGSALGDREKTLEYLMPDASGSRYRANARRRSAVRREIPGTKPRAAACPDDWTPPNRAWTHILPNRDSISEPLCPRCQAPRRPEYFVRLTDAKSRGLRKPRLAQLRGALLSRVACLSLGTPFRRRPWITGDRVCTLDPLPATSRVSRSPTTKPVRASIRTALATIWQQDWQYQPNAATMYVVHAGIVTGSKSTALSVATTCFQRHADGRSTGLKIRGVTPVWVQVPPSVLAPVTRFDHQNR